MDPTVCPTTTTNTTLGEDVGTTVLGEGCGFVPLNVGGCGILGWWSLGVFCVPQVSSAGHKWTPNNPQAQHP